MSEIDTNLIIPTRDKTFGSLELDPKNNIYLALAKAQGKFRQPVLNRTAVVRLKEGGSYTTHYADLNECIECVRVPLSENDLAFTHTVDCRDKTWLLVLTLRHSTGQLIESCMPINTNQSNQQLGGQLTYLKRYQLSAFFGLAADFDDDGNGTEGKNADIKSKAPAQGNTKTQTKPPQQAPKNAAPPAKSLEPEDIPQTQPDYEHQDQSKPENKKGPGDFVVSIGAKKHDGKKISQISESDLREMNTWIESQLRKVPPPKNMSKLFDLNTSIKQFFQSMDIKL